MMKKHLLILGVLFLLAAFGFAEDYTQWALPEGAVARLGKGEIRDVQFSPDGTRLAVATSIGIWLYNAHTGAEVNLLPDPSGDWVALIAFSPDGGTLAGGSQEGPVQLWDVDTGGHLSTLIGHQDWIRAMSFSADGKTLTTVSWNKQVICWDVSTGVQLFTFDLPPRKYSFGIFAFSPDSNTLAHSPAANEIQLWDVYTKNILTISSRFGDPSALAFSPDGKMLASSAWDIRVWDVETGRQLFQSARQTIPLTALSFSVDSKTLVSGNRDGELIVWNLDAPRLNPQPFRAPMDDRLSISALACSPDGQTVVSGGWSGTLGLWDIRTRKLRLTIKGHMGRLAAYRYLGNNKTVISCSSWGELRVWDTTPGNQRQVIRERHKQFAEITAAAFSQDNKTIASGLFNGEVQLWDVALQRFLVKFTGHRDFTDTTPGKTRVDTVAFSPDNSVLASGSRDNTIRLWDVPNRRHLSTLVGHTDKVNVVIFSPDGKPLASASKDKTVQLWDIDTGRTTTLLPEREAEVQALAFSPDGRILVTGRRDGLIQRWDTKTRQFLSNFNGEAGRVTTLAFSADGSTFASGNSDGLVRIWNISTNTMILNILPGHTARVTQLVFSDDGKELVSSSHDGTLLVWALDNIGHVDR